MAETTVVLAHGAWHGAWCWDAVCAGLDERGIRSIALELPMTTLDADAGMLRSTLDGLNGDAVVMGHSWGGSVVTLGASGAPNAKHLIYLCAILGEAGYPVGVVPPLAPGEPPRPRSKGILETADSTIVDPSVAYDFLYHDVDRALADQAISKLRPFSLKGYNVVETTEPAAWSTIPTTYVVCTDDRTINPDNQRRMALDADEVVEWPVSHSPFLSRPDLVVDLLTDRVQRLKD